MLTCRIRRRSRSAASVTKSPYQLTLQSPDTEELYRVATAFQAEDGEASWSAGCDQRFADRESAGERQYRPRQSVRISALQPQQIEDALYTAYGQRQVSTIYAPNDEYWVIMELEDKYQKDPAALSLLYVRSSNGTLVPLNAVASLTSESRAAHCESPRAASGGDDFV